MAIPKKGSRTITVDGVAYRWRIRRKPTYDQGLAHRALTFAVELAQDPGSVLVVTTCFARPDNWLQAPGRTVLPAEVADTIRTALRQGWRPDQPGPAMRMGASASPEPVPACPSGHSVDVLLKVYAKYLDGREATLNQRIEDALGGSNL